MHAIEVKARKHRICTVFYLSRDALAPSVELRILLSVPGDSGEHNEMLSKKS